MPTPPETPVPAYFDGGFKDVDPSSLYERYPLSYPYGFTSVPVHARPYSTYGAVAMNLPQWSPVFSQASQASQDYTQLTASPAILFSLPETYYPNLSPPSSSSSSLIANERLTTPMHLGSGSNDSTNDCFSDHVSHDSATESPSRSMAPLKKRSRTAQACEKCRVRKAKCSGSQPCTRCITKKLSCIYTATTHAQHTRAATDHPSPLPSRPYGHITRKEKSGRSKSNREEVEKIQDDMPTGDLNPFTMTNTTGALGLTFGPTNGLGLLFEPGNTLVDQQVAWNPQWHLPTYPWSPESPGQGVLPLLREEDSYVGMTAWDGSMMYSSM